MKKYAIIGIGAALTFVLGGTLVPLFQFLPFPALRAIMLAPIYAACAWTILERVNEPLTITLFGTVLGMMLTMFMPWLLPISVASAVICEFLPGSAAKAIAFPALQFPMMWVATMGWSVQSPLYYAVGIVILLLGFGLGLVGVQMAQLISQRVRIKRGVVE